MPRAYTPARETNPVFARPQTGVSTNHSSSVPSTEHTQNVGHEQADDVLQDVSPPQDPNLSGWTETQDCYTYIAGRLDGWRENDDYREFFERSVGCNGMLVCDSPDGDYDDNGGIPTAIGEPRGYSGAYQSPETRRSNAATGFSLGTVVVRRI